MIIDKIDCPKCNNKIDVYLNLDLGENSNCKECNIEISFANKRKKFIINYKNFSVSNDGIIHDHNAYFSHVRGNLVGILIQRKYINKKFTIHKNIINSSLKEAFEYLNKYIDNLVFA